MPQGKIKDPSIGVMLRALRKEKGAKSPQLFAKMMGGKYSVAGILRRENSDISLDFEYLEDFCRALNIFGDEREQLMVKAKVGQLRVSGDTGKVREVYTELYKTCHKQYIYSGIYIPRFLQTVDYAIAILGYTRKDPVELAKKRVGDAQSVREDRTKMIRVACPEAALYMAHGTPLIMIEQLESLLKFEDAPNFEFRILPSDVFVKTITGEVFTTLDDKYCQAESYLGVMTSRIPKLLEA